MSDMAIQRNTAAGAWQKILTLGRPPAFDDRVSHYFLIDMLRGLSALAVVFWHYQDFYFPYGARQPAGDFPQSQPFFSLLHPLYEGGHYAVQLFWMISGFVFSAVYGSRKSTTRQFAVNRFARLYPLHFLTLVTVAIIQFCSVRWGDRTLLFDNNDAYHFTLNLFFASNWGFERGMSFNGPIWSVSVEVLIYGLFWLSLPILFRGGIIGPFLMLTLCGLAAIFVDPTMIFLCGFFFFAGALIFVVHSALSKSTLMQIAVAGLLIAAAPLDYLISGQLHMVSLVLPSLFGGVILVLAALEGTKFRAIGQRQKWIGESTYSIYLWHLPLVMTILLGMAMLNIPSSVAHSPWFLLCYIVTVLVVARVSFLFFERPMREKIRKLDSHKTPPSRNVDPGIAAP